MSLRDGEFIWSMKSHERLFKHATIMSNSARYTWPYDKKGENIHIYITHPLSIDEHPLLKETYQQPNDTLALQLELLPRLLNNCF